MRITILSTAFPFRGGIAVFTERLARAFHNAGDNVAHFAHLGGMLFGFFLIKYWKRNPGKF